MKYRKYLLVSGILCAACSVSAASLSLGLRKMLSDRSITGLHEAPAMNERIPLILTLSDSEDLAQLDSFEFESDVIVGNVVTGTLPVANLYALAESEFIVSISEPKTAHTLLDVTRQVTGVDRVQNPDPMESDIIAYTGRGVVIGVIDVGIDPTHPAFRDENGLPTKIVEFHTTVGAAENTSKRLTAKVFTDPNVILGRPIDISSNGHGTHTASTAAGCFPGNEYRGIAPDADLVLTQVGGAIYDDEIIYGLNAAKEYAENNGRPMVASISIGTISGAHDGTGDVCLAAEALADAGHVVCIAAGNDGDREISYRHNFSTQGEEIGSAFIYPDSGAPAWAINFEAWSIDSRPAEIKFEVRDLYGKKVYETKWFDAEQAAQENGVLNVMHERQDYSIDPELNRYFIGSLTLGMGLEPNNRYLIEVASDFRITSGNLPYYLCFRMRSESGADMVMYANPFNTAFGSVRQNDYFVGTAAQSINNYSTSRGAISVGSYNARELWQNLDGSWSMLSENSEGYINRISLTSGYGNLCDGSDLVLPHVVAPGTNIVAAFNSEVTGQKYKRMAMAMVDGKEYFWGRMSGTSMSTPIVAGIVALWLEANATLTRDQILEVLDHSSVRDELIEETPERVRFGKIDAFEGLRYISEKFGFVSAPSVEAETPGLSVRYQSDVIECIIPESGTEADVQLFDASGRVCESFRTRKASFEVNRPSAPGVYILSVATPARRYTQKLLVK